MSATSLVEIALDATVVLQATENITDGLGAIARVCADIALDGTERFRAFTGASAVKDAKAALDASEIDQNTYDAIVFAFSQPDRPSTFYVVRQVVTTDDESVDDALSAAAALGLQAGFSYLFLLIDDRNAADHVALSTYAQARRAIAVCQSSDGGWITAGVPTGYASIVGNNQTIVLYEDTDAVQYEAGWAARQAAANPDERRPSGRCRIAGMAEYGTLLGGDDRTNLKANRCNYHAPEVPNGANRAVWPATMLDGTQFGLVYTKLYLELRIIQGVGQLLAQKLAANEDIPANATGASMALGAVRRRMDVARSAGHITPNPNATPNPLPNGYTLSATVTGTTLAITGQASGQLGIVDLDVRINLAT
jgi:hypothetical protein